MAHSLGNRVLLSLFNDGKHQLRNGKDAKFNTVFMVGADVWEETFNERVIDGSVQHPDFRNDKVGLHLMEITDKNIVIVHATNDIFLGLSARIHRRCLAW